MQYGSVCIHSVVSGRSSSSICGAKTEPTSLTLAIVNAQRSIGGPAAPCLVSLAVRARTLTMRLEPDRRAAPSARLALPLRLTSAAKRSIAAASMQLKVRTLPPL
eukprot:CAMPEP_0179934166 /NCGR_PEP_ID=MMETSP0983-20121128/12296_1 /TAXON_ID=483367 /ORGANISM="non described non described, Strain CCMP 2436" /LENGTH=104 /DNA_ID=CAMNT_0021839099 /DNA_START=386 /DNA_END=700 /DNA_ORIENTATION=-